MPEQKLNRITNAEVKTVSQFFAKPFVVCSLTLSANLLLHFCIVLAVV